MILGQKCCYRLLCIVFFVFFVNNYSIYSRAFFGREAVQGRITNEIGGLVGVESAEAIQNMIASAALENNSIFAVIVGVIVLIFGATGVFFQLQKALNNIWSVRAINDSFWDVFKRRAISFSMVLAVGLLLLVSLVLSAFINGLSSFIGENYSNISSILVEILNFVFSQLIITALFATIFTILPDIHIKWRTSLRGAFMTSLLFLAGKYIIGFYFSQSDPASVYGAAGSVVLILLWVYYTCLILFFGAEFTVNWALLNDIKITPTSDATLSYEKEMMELRKYKKKVEADKKKAEKLKHN